MVKKVFCHPARPREIKQEKTCAKEGKTHFFRFFWVGALALPPSSKD